MRVDSSNVNEFKDLDIHDAELIDINCNYQSHEVSISAILNIPKQKKQMIHFCFKEFSFFSISCEEPWGSGIYFFEATAKDAALESEILDGQYAKMNFEFLLNSGDRINITASYVEWNLENI
ncbi:hypothetical protein [Paenibacillus sp. MMS18-CY102]|uniref:hypothetical protein n=1 Tax=Paenibacillus sp. MMS18-CY102 TaxID=2682849 RepID=UPI001365CECB|nr:hypothetical protein [Paenibacillus sp. MMS18-CY102]MWC27058.1 hypothetical protein [Paenibacillus sp. MMS18-CY102]